MAIYKGRTYLLPFAINATDLAAGTTQYIPAPEDGFVEEISVVVAVAISTGGVIKAKIASTDVIGCTVTAANSDAAGTVYNASTTKGGAGTGSGGPGGGYCAKNTAIQIIVDAAFTGGSAAVNGWLRFTGGK